MFNISKLKSRLAPKLAADQAKAQKERVRALQEARLASLNEVHHYMFDHVARYFDVPMKHLLDQITDNQTCIDILLGFTNGVEPVVMFFHQEGFQPRATNSLEGLQSPSVVINSGEMKFTATNGYGYPLSGCCFYFIKERKDMIVDSNNMTLLMRGCFSAKEHGILEEAYTILMMVYNEFFAKANNEATWGNLTKSVTGKKAIQSFVDYFFNFTCSFKTANESVKGVVTLPKFDPDLQLNRVKKAQQCVQLAANEAACRSVESTILRWCSIIRQTLITSSTLRVDKDDEGPLVELEYWRHLNIKYNSILEEIRSHDCRMAIQVLNIINSKVLKVWFSTNDKLTNVTNEARDNVTYLYQLEKYCKALYHGDPVTLVNSLLTLMNSISIIFTISSYYNNSEKATGLLLKVTNQMLIMCRAYLTNHGKETIWRQPRKEVIAKIDDCLKLRESYKDAYRWARNKLARVPGGIIFDFSEQCIFGKFDAFCRRLEEIKYILNCMETYSVLKTCLIDGIDPISIKMQALFNGLMLKSYDILELRKPDFQRDFQAFNKTLNDLEMTLYNFVNTGLSKINATLPALKYVQRLQQLNIPKLDCSSKYEVLFKQYGRELEDIKNVYLNNYLDPPIHNDVSPLIGKICWARILSKKIETPIHYFTNNMNFMNEKMTKKIVYNYNIIQQTLVEFEMIYHTTWYKSVENLKDLLQVAPLAKSHSEINVNLDAVVLQVFSESDNMIKMNLSIPNRAKVLMVSEHDVKQNKYFLQLILNRTKSIKKKPGEFFNKLFGSSFRRVNFMMVHAMKTLTWTSPGLSLYCSNMLKELDNLELSIDTLFTLKKRRIDKVFESISNTLLFDIDIVQAWTLTQYMEEMNKQTKENAVKLSLASLNVQQTIKSICSDVVDMCLQTLHGCLYVSEDKENFERQMKLENNDVTPIPLSPVEIDSELNFFAESLKKFYTTLSNKFTNCLFETTKSTAEAIRNRLIHSSETNSPLILSTLTLQHSVIVLSPSVEELQECLSQGNEMLLQIFNNIPLWDQEKVMPWMTKRLNMRKNNMSFKDQKCQNMRVTKTEISENYEKQVVPEKNVFYEVVSENKDIQSLLNILSDSLDILNSNIFYKLSRFNKFNFLWEESIETYLEDFMKTDPQISEFSSELTRFDKLEEETDDLPEKTVVGPFLLDSTELKEIIKNYISNWKSGICRILNQKYKVLLNGMLTFMDEQAQSLSRQLRDLEDIRLLMICLDNILEREIELDMNIIPIEEAYSLLGKYQFETPQEELNSVDTLRYKFRNLLQQHKETLENLHVVAPKFKDELITSSAGLSDQVEEFHQAYMQSGPTVPGLEPAEASERLNYFVSLVDGLLRTYQTCSGGEQLFGLPVTEQPLLNQYSKEIKLLKKLYSLYNNVNDTIDGYYDLLWSDVDIESIVNDLNDFKNKFKKLPKKLQEWQAYHDLSKKLEDFSESCPLLELMASKTMELRHWDKISEITKTPIDVKSNTFRLRDLMRAPLLQYSDEIEDTCISSVKEKDIESKLKNVVEDWSNQKFQFQAFKNRGELMLKTSDVVEINSKLEDSLMVLNYLLSNRYNVPYRKSIQEWIGKLSVTLDIIEKLLLVQNLWIYLEAVFVGGDIAKQLPAEAKRFSDIDKGWVRIMQKAHDELNVVNTCVGDDLLGHMLPHLHEQLEFCQKSLTGYLECKRAVFPRFYFVSDPVLLEILGQASDCHTIQPHLSSIAENIDELEFSQRDYDHVLAAISREGEKIPLEGNLKAVGNVENWLGELLVVQQKSLHQIIRVASMQIKEEDFNLLTYLYESIAQVGLLALQFLWTSDAEEAMLTIKYNKTIMTDTAKKFLSILNMFIDQTTKPLTKYEVIKFETLITIHLHQKDIFDDLVKLHIKSPSDFEWLKQSRFYFNEEEDRTQCNITDVINVYQNEFIGCQDRLVITPLTDRCYITMAQSLGMSMGAAPAGPAGTGKTETVKDMGKALGKYVVVFNCSDQMDFRGLGRIFKGLAQSGSWGCFDEFNRIDLPVLSVAAQQINIVLMAKKNKKKYFLFSDNETVSMNPEFGIFLTMNPGYAGRQELPENLKVMFRTVAMMVPDRMIIIRIKMASNGFLENVELSQKFFVLYKLCEEQLSKQVHYDFGLRNILSVLRTFGTVKKTSMNEPEALIVMKVLKDLNISKLVDEDEPLLLSLIEDLFPNLTTTPVVYKQLQAAIVSNTAQFKLINYPAWNLKVLQLFETQRVRHGMMTLGPSGAGKTCCINILMRSLTDCGHPHKEMRMNPKAITASQMFGRLDVASNDWTDGVFSALWRKTLKVKKSESVWLVLDGPVDAIWIENLNSVLDDTKKLTLANGDRIPMAPNCKIIFEVHNIDNASPATVSRNGMVFMSSSCLTWKPILQGWLLTRPAQEGEVFGPLFDKIYQDIVTFSTVSLTKKMEILQCMEIKQACDLLEGLIKSYSEKGSHLLSVHYQRLFIFALMWSFGNLLELDGRLKLQEFMLTHPSKLLYPKLTAERTIFEYTVDANGDWIHWSEKVPDYLYPTDHVPEYSGILIPNVDNVRTNFLIETISKQKKAVLLIGEQGTAKTVMIKGFLSHYDKEKHLSKSIVLSSATTPNIFQSTIENSIEKRIGAIYGPPGGKKMTVFIDDVNMPLVNDWGDQPTNEAVRLLMESKGFYNLLKPGEFSSVVDMQFIAAMIHPGGGRNDIPQRLKRQFSIFNCTLPSNNSMDKIFGTIALGYFCPERGFNSEVIGLIDSMVPLTRNIWQSTKNKMLPTPAKFHYIFNLRDLSRIWEGLLMVKSGQCDNEMTLMALWKHECTRVIADRFVSHEDKKWFDTEMNETIMELSSDNPATLEAIKEPYFVDILRDEVELTGDEPEDFVGGMPHLYERLPSLDVLHQRLNYFMDLMTENTKGTTLSMVLFKDAMVHIVKVLRIMRNPGGNALLVGVGGSGKKSTVKLASYIYDCTFYQIIINRLYSVNNLLDDLKTLLRATGGGGKCYSFCFTDNEIKDESFLDYINNLLSTGEISGLFPRDEMDEILQGLVPVMKKEFPKIPPTNENLTDYFFSRTKKNLHIILCFSPVGSKFRSRSLKFPGLISGCTMDWFSVWPVDALYAVSSHYLSDLDIVISKKSVRNNLIKSMGEVHNGVANSCQLYFQRFRRQTHVTPKSFLNFVSTYKQCYKERLLSIEEKANRMSIGLSKLDDATLSVDILTKELVVKNKDLAFANIKADKVLAEVTESTREAEVVKQGVLVVKLRAEKIVNEIAHEKSIAEDKLELARPAMEEAEAALGTIKAQHISTVRKLAKPPHLIMRIMDCVLILLGKKLDPIVPDPERACPKPSWQESLKLMGNLSFLNSLLFFPKDTINAEIVELLQPYLSMEDFTLESAKKVCGDVAGLASWIRAMCAFYAVNREVLPLKANLAVSEAKLVLATNELNGAQAQLDEKEAVLQKVQELYDAAQNEKQGLLDDAMACKKKMETASLLISRLAGEHVRWTNQSKEFAAEIERLVGDVFILTSFLSYTGPFNQEFRSKLVNGWYLLLSDLNIPHSTNLVITTSLVDNTTVVEWNLQGLPSDELSTQNGIIVTQSSKYPLLIDPQGQGRAWIMNLEASRELIVTNFNHKYFRQQLEECLSLGKPLLVENVLEEMETTLDNVLEKNYVKMGTGLKVMLGDKECDVMSGFRIYFTTKLPNPAYFPEVYALLSIIDFTVTMKGLEDQLLNMVVVSEQSQLEAERVQLIETVNMNKIKMKELEANLLEKLSSTEGSLLDDESVLVVLNTTKVTAVDVSLQLAVADDTEMKINKAREEYRPVATRGSILYFLLSEMSAVNCMYQTSLKQFLGLFDLSIQNSEKTHILGKRLSNIIEHLTYEVYKFTNRGLYEEHKFLLSLFLTLKKDLQSNNIQHIEFNVLLKGGASLDMNSVPHKPFKWLTDSCWLNVIQLSRLHGFAEVPNQMQRSEKAWKEWLDKAAPEEETFPDNYQNLLSTFQKLLFIRSLCPDRTIAQARKYIAESMGPKFIESVILDLKAMVDESNCRTPLICLLTMGSDPTAQIEDLAKKSRIETRAISMGQGQEVHARNLLNLFVTTGGWAMLQNCHLALAFMHELFDMILSMPSIHPTFRLWITTEIHPLFHVGLLQMSVKYTNDPPQGIKAGLMRTYTSNVNQDLLEATTLSQWRAMLYGVSFLHTIVQERRKFGPLGWNIPYEFNLSDWSASVQFVQNHLDEMDVKMGVSWVTVRYMLGEIQYGGRVTDDYDKRLLNTYCKTWFGEFMFGSNFEFYKEYGIPTKLKSIPEIKDFIQLLPAVDPPEAFGLHSNAGITYQTTVSKDILNTILSIQPKESSSGGETRESVVYNMAEEMLSKLPATYLRHVIKTRMAILGHLQPLNIFFRQELDRMIKVLNAVSSTLIDLKLAIDGTIIMNEDLKDALDNIYDAKVPNVWTKVSWESSSVGFWFTELLDRNAQFYSWLYVDRPLCFWITGFFNPQGFLTAMRQEVTRAHKGWSLDNVVLQNEMTTKWTKEEINAAPPEGVYVYGLFLEGAAWDRRASKLIESPPKILFSNLPVIRMFASITPSKDTRLYICPLYKKPRRTDLNFISRLTMRTTQSPDHWILRGTAALADIK